MAKPVSVTYTFATQTSNIPLAYLDTNYNNILTQLNDTLTYNNFVLDIGVANAYVVNFAAGLTTSYTAGLTLTFLAANANTGASTINVNGLGAKNIVNTNGSALASGQIAANSLVCITYDGTSFQLMNDASGSGVIPGNLTVNGNFTVTGTSTLSGLTASTALALNASKQVVSVTNTGTGDNVLATSPTLITPNLGTPTAVDLTNATNLPIGSGTTGTLAVSRGGTGLTAGTSGGVLYYSATGTLASSAALTANAIVLGGGAGAAPATTTTGTGVVTALGNTADAASGFATTTGTATLTNKRVNPRVVSAASASSLTPDISAADQYAYTALAANLTINAPTGTPVDGNKLIFRILDNGTGRTLSWNATYTVIGVTLPTTTTANKTLYVGCIYNANNTRWDVIAVSTQA